METTKSPKLTNAEDWLTARRIAWVFNNNDDQSNVRRVLITFPDNSQLSVSRNIKASGLKGETLDAEILNQVRVIAQTHYPEPS